MKILLISNYLPDRQESMLRYADLLQAELARRGHRVSMVHPPARLLRWLGAGVPGAKWIGYLDKYLLAPGYLRRRCREADIVHICDHSNSMYLRLVGNTPSLITCHDLLAVFAAQGKFPGQTTGFTGRLLQRWIASGLRRARTVICVSHKTERDLQELAHGTPPPTYVVHHPLNWDYHPVAAGSGRAVLAARGVPGDGAYLLHIGSNSWYKNRPAAVRIFAALKATAPWANAKLILAGKPWDDTLRAVVLASAVSADIVELKQVSNEELRALYSDAAALLFPSREEGFGWPILEAQACGCPVITTDRAPMTEIAGDAAILIDPQDPEGAAQTILSYEGRFAELRDRGMRNLERFSIERAMAGYERVYQQVLGTQRAASKYGSQ